MAADEDAALRAKIPFIERENELSRMQKTLASVVQNKEPGFLLVRGDFGTGKTALVEKFLRGIVESKIPAAIGRGRCALEMELNGLVPFHQVLADLVIEGRRTQIIPENWREFIIEVGPAWLDIFTAGTVGAIVQTIQSTKKLIGKANFSQDNVFTQFSNTLSRLSENQLLIIFLDDLQWADASSLQLLFHLARNLKGRSILVIAAYRPVEALEASHNRDLFTTIRANLIRFGTAEIEIVDGINVSQYARTRYPMHQFSSQLTTDIQKKTDGHPLFVSQLFTWWEETHIIKPIASGGQTYWTVDAQMQVADVMPRSLSELLDERIHLMEDKLRDILACAAIEGEDFTVQVIGRLKDLNDLDVIDSLKTLERRYFMIEEQWEQKEDEKIILDFYRFVHRFFREHIYQGLGSGERRLLHRKVAVCLEAIYSDRAKVAGQLALHYRMAREPQKSIEYALVASRYENSRFTPTESLKWCEFGLEQVPEISSSDVALKLELNLLEQAGLVYHNTGRHTLAHNNYQKALVLADRIQARPEHVAQLYYKQADVCKAQDQLEESLQLIDMGRQILRQNNIPLGEIYILLGALWGLIQSRLGNNRVAADAFEQIARTFEGMSASSEFDEALAQTYHYYAVILKYLNRYEEAITTHKKSIELAGRIGWKALVATNLNDMAKTCLRDNRINEGRAALEQALQIGIQIGDLGVEAFARTMWGSLLIAESQYSKAILELNRAIALSEHIGAEWNTDYMYAELSIAYLWQSEKEKAAKAAEYALEYARKIGRQFGIGHASLALARVRLAGRDLSAASDLLHKAIYAFQQAGDVHYEMIAQRDLGEALIHLGEHKKGLEALRLARNAFERMGLFHERVLTENILGRNQA